MRPVHLIRTVLVALVIAAGFLFGGHAPFGKPPRPGHMVLPASAQANGLVVGVLDGDTIDVRVQEAPDRFSMVRVRFLGIDAPEKAQPFGARAKQHLSDLIFGKEVTLLSRGPDRYGRTLAKVVCGGLDINLAMVQAGMAWHYVHYVGNQFPGDAEAYAKAERAARAGGLGLWADPTPIPPWDWRHRKGGEQ